MQCLDINDNYVLMFDKNNSFGVSGFGNVLPLDHTHTIKRKIKEILMSFRQNFVK